MFTCVNNTHTHTCTSASCPSELRKRVYDHICSLCVSLLDRAHMNVEQSDAHHSTHKVYALTAIVRGCMCVCEHNRQDMQSRACQSPNGIRECMRACHTHTRRHTPTGGCTAQAQHRRGVSVCACVLLLAALCCSMQSTHSLCKTITKPNSAAPLTACEGASARARNGEKICNTA